MKFRNLGRVTLALAVSLVLIGGMDSCHYNYTNSYVIVTGSQYNQITSYRLDNDTGQLFPANTVTNNLSSGGDDPIRAVLLTGGRYVYVLNHGKPTVNSDGSITWVKGNISVFSIGGDGTLSYQLTYNSQGNGSERLQLSAGGNFLYVLDEYEPSGTAATTPGSTTYSAATPCYDASTGYYRPVGDVSVYSIDGSTGRLYLVPNQELQNSSGSDLTYFPLGCSPIDMYSGSGYLYTAEVSDPSNPADTSSTGAVIGDGEIIYAYQADTNGQLLQAPGGSQIIGGTKGISVLAASASGTYIYALDAATNTIYPFKAGANGLLSSISGTSFPNEGGTGVDVGMDALMTDSSTGWLYIANTSSGGVLTASNSGVSAFIIDPSSGDLSPLAEPQSPFPTGSGPVCIFEDPSHKYVYTADAASSQITGAQLDPRTGILTNLSHGTAFATVGTPTWCIDSPNVD